MTRAPSSLLVVAIVALAGCPRTVTRMNRLPATEPLAEPVSIDRPGPLLHEPSGLTFAESYGDFRRVTALRYDSAGLHVGVGYDTRDPGCLVVATFFVYPTPHMSFVAASPDVVRSLERDWLAKEFARAKAEIAARHASESPDETPGAAAPRGAVLDGPSLAFAEAGKLSELRVLVYDHAWFIESRLTYPDACRDDARRRLDALLGALPWERT